MPHRMPSFARKLLKSSIGIGLIVGIGWFPMQTVLEASSVDASVNSQLTVIRAPISGRLEADIRQFSVGADLWQGDHLLTVIDDRADRQALFSTEAELSKLIHDRGVAAEQLSYYEDLRKRMTARVSDFIDNRETILNPRIDAAKAKSIASQADLTAAQKALERAQALASKGAGNVAALEEAQRRVEVAQSALQASSAELLSSKIELTALRGGQFIGDGYNDVPRTQQRVDEIDLNILTAKAEVSKLEQHIASTKQLIEARKGVYRDNAVVDMKVPRDGQVWGVLATPGEAVTQGQELLRLLDCKALLVTATVDEITFNDLSYGEGVYFRPKSSRERYKGKIVQLSGRTPAQSNLALPPKAGDEKKDFFVTAALEPLQTEECLVAKTGRLIFTDTKR